MRKIIAVLRHHHAGLSQRDISRLLGIGYGTVASYLTRATNAKLSWPLPEQMSERDLELALFPETNPGNVQQRFAKPDYPRVHIEVKKPGMTKQLAWEEYRQAHPVYQQ